MAWRALLVVVIAICGAVYLEFGVDVRTPYSLLATRAALVTHNHPVPDRLASAIGALKAKYGQDADIRQLPTALVVERNGQFLASQPAPSEFHEALGMTQVVDSQAGVTSTFPFDVSPYEQRDGILPALVPNLKMRVGRIFAGGSPDFDLDDFSIEGCRSVSPSDLGLDLAGRILSLGNSTMCTSVWKHPPFHSMLVGIVVAKGGSWIRPFARGACRILSNAWLANTRQAATAPRPDYLECLLVDRPDNQPFGSGVSAFAYEVRQDGSLAAFAPDPTVLRERPLPVNPNLPTWRQRKEARERQR
jgi:hypothetical protein